MSARFVVALMNELTGYELRHWCQEGSNEGNVIWYMFLQERKLRLIILTE